jgi:hypothetical protein
MDQKSNLKINEKAVKEAEHLNGKYLIRTSDDTLSTEDIVYRTPLSRHDF